MSANPRSFPAALARAWRSLRRRPGFLVIAVSSLAIALGLATTVIAQIDSLLHPYVAVRDPDRMYIMMPGARARGVKPPTIEQVLPVLRALPAVDSVAVIGTGYGLAHVGWYESSFRVEMLPRAYLDMIGVHPRLGRLFAANETMESGSVIVSDEIWRKYYDNRAAIDSATLTFENLTYRVVGVMPRNVTSEWVGELVFPIPAGEIARPMIMVRVKRGVTEADLNRAAEVAAKHLALTWGPGYARTGFYVRSMKPDPLQLSDFHRAMIGAALFILLIACANVSALMLARSVANRRDQALRMAMGAGRSDLLRDVLAEVALLAVIGGAAGIMIADWSMRVMVATTPVQLGWMGFLEPRWNVRVFGLLFVAVMAAIAVASLIPAWYVSKIQPAEPLKDSSANTTGRPARRFQLLVVGELTLAMVLLMGAALIVKTAGKVQTFDFGYNARLLSQVAVNAVVVPAFTPMKTQRDSSERQHQILQSDVDAIVASVRALPEVKDAAWVSQTAIFDGAVVSDATAALDTSLFAPQKFIVGPGFFRAIGLPIIAGRDFVDGDRTGQGAVILDVRAAQHLFPSGNAVGGMVRFGTSRFSQWIRVVGITGNAIHELPIYPEMDPSPVVYATEPPGRWFGLRVIVRAKEGVRDALPAAVRATRSLIPTTVSSSGAKWIEEYDDMLSARRFVAGIFITLSFASLILATAGLFGVLSYAVGQRMREFAVRVALGADRVNIVRLVLRDGLVLALGGTAIGGLIALVAGFAVYQWLWGVYPVDAPSLVIAEGVLMSVTMAAAALPAVRAARANPVDVLRAM